jgi:hypothetical protein
VYTTPDSSTSTSASISSLPTLIPTSTRRRSPSPPLIVFHSTDTNPAFSNSTVSTGAIIGIVAGVVALLLLIIAILLFLLFRKRRQSRQSLGPQTLPMSATMNDGVLEPFIQSVGPNPFLNTVSSNGASTSDVVPNSASAKTPYGSSGNLNSFNSQNGGSSEAAGVASGSTMTMSSKQRRMQEDRALLPARQPQQHHHVPTRVSEGAGKSAYSGMENLPSHTGPMTSSSENTDYYDTSGSTPLSRPAAPGVGGRVAPWNSGLYPHGIPAPVQLVAPVPVPLGLPLGQSQMESGYSGRESEGRSRSAASGVTAPPPYIRSPPPFGTMDRGERVGGGLEEISEHSEKR